MKSLQDALARQAPPKARRLVRNALWTSGGEDAAAHRAVSCSLAGPVPASAFVSEGHNVFGDTLRVWPRLWVGVLLLRIRRAGVSDSRSGHESMGVPQ